jgi:thiol-disulfide isomerase/thioredoxin
MATRLLSGAVLVVMAVMVTGVRAGQDPAEPKFTAAMEKADAALKARRYQEAIDAYRQASNFANKKSPRAFLGLARGYHAMRAYKSSADACADALKLVAPDDAAMRPTLHNQRGLSLLELAASTGRTQHVKEAEAEFRAALAFPGSPSINWFNLGVSILKQGRDEEGVEALKTFVGNGAAGLDAAGKASLAEAEKMIENPRRARVAYAPDFSFATMAGDYVSLADLNGKALLLDFWGTWCAPCLAATPTLVNLYRTFSKPASDGTPAKFEMLGISSDSRNDEGKLREYVDKNKMLWPQHHDVSRAVHRLFQVNVFPTYIVVDGEGIIRDRIEGWNPSTSPSRLDGVIRRAMRERANSVPAPLIARPRP